MAKGRGYTNRGGTTERDPVDAGPPRSDEQVEPPPFDPDPNLVSFLERGRNDDPMKVWTHTQVMDRSRD